MSLLSCQKDKEVECNNAPFNKLFKSALVNEVEDEFTMDTQIQGYYFKLSQNAKVCKIGYQSFKEVASSNYHFSIVDSSSGKTIFIQSQTFSPNETSYMIPDNSVNLEKNKTYLIKRKITDYGQYISNTIGRVAIDFQNGINFPLNNGIITITGGHFYDGDFNKNLFPYIDLQFE